MRSPAPNRREAPPRTTARAAMASPSTGSPMRLVADEATAYTLRGLPFTVSGSAWECPDTLERYNTPEQVNEVLARVHHAWRAHHGIDRAALRARRTVLGLSAAQASALLGFGVNQYRTYENTDRLPSKSNAVLLKLLLDDRGLAALLAAGGAGLKAAIGRKVQGHLAQAGAGPAALASGATAQPVSIATSLDVSGGTLAQIADHVALGARRLAARGRSGALVVPQLLTGQVSVVLPGDYSYAMAA